VLVLLVTVARFRIVSLLFPVWVATMSLIVLLRRREAGAVASA
jgi:hypothetical protein